MKAKFKGLRDVDHYFWYSNIVENAKKLEPNKTYNITNTKPFSSWTSLTLDETGDLEYNAMWFDQII